MTRRSSSTSKSRLDRMEIDAIPPVTSREEITRLLLSIISFFHQDLTMQQDDNFPSPHFFSTIVPQDYQPTDEESHNLVLFAKKPKKSMFKYLASHPDLCRIAVARIPKKFFESNKRKNFYFQLLSISFYSDSLDLFKLAVVDTPQPPLKYFRKTQTGSLIQYIEQTSKIPGFYIDPDTLKKSIEHNLNDIPTATAFAASPTEIFVGKEGGFIRIVPINSNSVLTPQITLFRPSSQNDAYSLAWIKGYLWILTNTTIWQVNTLIPKVWTFANNKPRDLVPPMCTDGEYFYCVRLKNRYCEVHIFSFNGADFILERHVKLAGVIPSAVVDHKIPFATDGALITFAFTIKSREVNFRTYSLANGKIISDRVENSLQPFQCWCTLPFSNEHVIINHQNISFYTGQIQIPRWLIGLPCPSSKDSNPVINALELAYFHGATFFQSGSSGDIDPLLNYYGNMKCDSGFRIIAQILLQAQTRDLSPILHALSEYYMKSESNQVMQRFCCFVFLACIRENHYFDKNNILSHYLENDNIDLDFIFLYPKAFNFRRLSLSDLAIKKLIVFAAERWNEFPRESSYIISRFLQDYALLKMKEGSYDSILEPISAIFRVITKTVSLVFKSKYNPSLFINSEQFTIWGFLIRAIMKNFKTLPKYSHIFIRMMKVAFYDQHKEMIGCEKIREMMNCTLMLLLELYLNTPMKLYNVVFDGTESFYQKFPHPMNQEYSFIDKQIIKLLNRAYDISTPEEYASFFFKVRRSIIFDYNADCKILAEIKLKNISAAGLVDYLSSPKLSSHPSSIKMPKRTFRNSLNVDHHKVYLNSINTSINNSTPDSSLLIPIQDPNIREWFFDEFQKAYNRLTIEQIIIFSVFFDRFNHKLNEYSINIFQDIHWDFKEQFNFPFMFSAFFLKQLNFRLPVESIISLKPDVLSYCFDTINEVYNLIDNKEKLTELFTKYMPSDLKKPNYSNFVTLESEPDRFKAVLLWTIPVMNGFDINFSKYQNTYKAYIWSGSYRIIEAMMKGIVYIEKRGKSNLRIFYKFVISLITNYIVKSNSFFVMQTEQNETIASLFIIIQYLKKIFNSKQSSFKNYLEEVAKECKPNKAIAIFAILNNSLETVRKGVRAHFYSSENIEVEGVIDDFTDNSIRVNGVQYSLTSITKLWCKCPQKVSLNIISNFKVYAELFENTKYDQEYLNVFKYASLITFLKQKKFHKLLSHSFKNQFTKRPSPNYFQPEISMYDFFSYLALGITKHSIISFINVNEVNQESAISPIVQNCLLNNSELNDKTEGMLMTMDFSSKFVSSPIHPQCEMKIVFTLLASETKNDTPAMILNVFGLSRMSSIVSKSDKIKISSNPAEQVVTEIFFNPIKSIFSIKIDNKIENETAISPSIDILYLTIELSPSMILEYKVQFENVMKEVEKYPHCFSFENTHTKLMKIARPPIPLPITDSSIYNNFSLQQASNYISNCFSQLISMQILLFSRRKQKPKENLIMRILANCNAFPYDETLNFKELKISYMVEDLGQIFHSFALNNLYNPSSINLDNYIKATKQLIKPYTKCIVSTNNRSALYIRKNQLFPSSNCFVFSNKAPPQQYGFSTGLTEVGYPCAVIPFSLFHGTIVDCLIYLRHLIGVFVAVKNYDFTPIKNILKKLTKQNKLIQPFFAPIVEMMEILCPGSLNYDSAFLIKESIVHSDQKKYIIPKFAPEFVTPYVMSIQLPGTLNIQNARYIYITTKMPGTPFSVIVSNSHGRFVIKPDSYAVLDGDEFNIKAKDPQNANASIEVHSYPIEIGTVPNHLYLWLPHHSHQLICSLGENQNLSPEIYNQMPISTKFSLSVASFILSMLKKGNSSLFRFKSHLFLASHGVSRGLIKNQNFAIPRYEEVSSTKFENTFSNFDYCKSIADCSSNNENRIKFLKENKMTVMQMINPDWVRIEPERTNYSTFIPNLKIFLKKNIKFIDGSKIIAEWIQNYIQKMSDFVVLMFIEYITGKWGAKVLQMDNPSSIYIYHVHIPDKIEVIQEEHLFIVGLFQNEHAFRYKLMVSMQEYQDSLFDYNK